MVTALPIRSGRAGAISASTVFAVVMAIVAGLIFTLVFKTVVLDKKPAAGPAAAKTIRMTVAARNIRDKTEIRAADVKAIAVSQEQYDQYVKEAKDNGTTLLEGAQPIGRTTTKPINAEKPIWLNQTEEFTYPRPVSELLAPGKRAVVIEVPANSAMIQVGDHVDVLATLDHSSPLAKEFETTTAMLAKNLKVVARFGSTRTAAQPNPGPRRTYTVEASPYRASLLELAKNVGCTFSLPVSPRTMTEDGRTAAGGDTELEDPPDKDKRVTEDDLRKIFGVKPKPADPVVWEVERYSGVAKSSSLLFPKFVNPRDEKKEGAPAAGQPGEKGTKPAVNVPPQPPVKPPVPRNPVVPTANQNQPRRSASLPAYRAPGATSTARNNTVTFRPPPAARQAKGCQTCGK